MTQDKKEILATSLYPDEENTYPNQYNDQDIVDAKRKGFIAGLNHAESTHSKDIGELVEALKHITRVSSHAGFMEVYKDFDAAIEECESLIQKHSSNT